MHAFPKEAKQKQKWTTFTSFHMHRLACQRNTLPCALSILKHRVSAEVWLLGHQWISRGFTLRKSQYHQYTPVAWWEWSCWGGSPINGTPPPPVILLLLFGLGRVSCRRHNMQWPSVIAQYIWVNAGARRDKPPAVRWQSSCGGPGASPLEAPKNLRYLILGLILPNNRWMVMNFFMCIAVQSHRKIPKVQVFNSQVSETF